MNAQIKCNSNAKGQQETDYGDVTENGNHRQDVQTVFNWLQSATSTSEELEATLQLFIDLEDVMSRSDLNVFHQLLDLQSGGFTWTVEECDIITQSLQEALIGHCCNFEGPFGYHCLNRRPSLPVPP